MGTLIRGIHDRKKCIVFPAELCPYISSERLLRIEAVIFIPVCPNAVLAAAWFGACLSEKSVSIRMPNCYYHMQSEHDSKELTILNYIDQHAHATQRELSERVGVSLGAVNLLLKKMVGKGLVKIERLQPNSIKYFLTPAGIADKIERTYGYVVRTYSEINRLRARIVTVTDAVAQTHHTETILFFGQGDELVRLIEDLIKTGRFTSEARLHHTVKTLTSDRDFTDSVPVVVWNHRAQQVLTQADIPNLNIMSMLVV